MKPGTSAYRDMTVKQHKAFNEMDALTRTIVNKITSQAFSNSFVRNTAREAVASFGRDTWDKNVSLLGTGIYEMYLKQPKTK